MTTESLYRAILDGHTVKVTVRDKKEFETIRTALHRHHRLVKELGGSEFSLLANLNGQEALFRLGISNRTKKQYLYDIVIVP